MEFTQKEEDRTGERRIVLQRISSRSASAARQKGDVDGAIKAYASTERDHPDYAGAPAPCESTSTTRRLRPRESPSFRDRAGAAENQQLIYKQFAVTFTNLGHAYARKATACGQRSRRRAHVLRQGDQSAADRQAEYALSSERRVTTRRCTTLLLHGALIPQALPDDEAAAVMNSASLAWREYFDSSRKARGQSDLRAGREGRAGIAIRSRNPDRACRM